jgi:hypothetical protein
MFEQWNSQIFKLFTLVVRNGIQYYEVVFSIPRIFKRDNRFNEFAVKLGTQGLIIPSQECCSREIYE